MALTLHFHPLSSYCQKVLTALYETGLPFEGRILNLGDPAEVDAFRRLWPIGKMPVLVDDGAVVAESSIIIEHLDRLAPSSALMGDADARLEVRFLDRVFDQHVHEAMQSVVDARLRNAPDAERLTATARDRLGRAYDLLEARLPDEGFAAGPFSMADCAAAPALFYAAAILPFADRPRLSAYFERLLVRPSFARALAEARPWIGWFPFHDDLEPRFQKAEG